MRLLGFSYQAGALIPDGTPLPDIADPVTDYIPCARPGSRAPHHWIELNGHQRSTIDRAADHPRAGASAAPSGSLPQVCALATNTLHEVEPY